MLKKICNVLIFMGNFMISEKIKRVRDLHHVISFQPLPITFNSALSHDSRCEIIIIPLYHNNLITYQWLPSYNQLGVLGWRWGSWDVRICEFGIGYIELDEFFQFNFKPLDLTFLAHAGYMTSLLCMCIDRSRLGVIICGALTLTRRKQMS